MEVKLYRLFLLILCAHVLSSSATTSFAASRTEEEPHLWKSIGHDQVKEVHDVRSFGEVKETGGGGGGDVVSDEKNNNSVNKVVGRGQKGTGVYGGGNAPHKPGQKHNASSSLFQPSFFFSVMFIFFPSILAFVPNFPGLSMMMF